MLTYSLTAMLSFVLCTGSPYTVAVGFQGGDVLLMRGYDDCIPQVIVKTEREAAHFIHLGEGRLGSSFIGEGYFKGHLVK